MYKFLNQQFESLSLLNYYYSTTERRLCQKHGLSLELLGEGVHIYHNLTYNLNTIILEHLFK